jgi:hypothetical protein
VLARQAHRFPRGRRGLALELLDPNKNIGAHRIFSPMILS